MEKQKKNLEQLCREIFGTVQEEELRDIAKKAEKYDLLREKEARRNVRNAGRKAMFERKDIQEMALLYREGMTVEKLAQKFHTSRQTISKYLAGERRRAARRNITLRMNYMHDNDVCTVLDVDFTERRIYIRNTTNNILWRAFGVKEEPTWEDFEEFLESRCFPRKHIYLKEIEQNADTDSRGTPQDTDTDSRGTPQDTDTDSRGTPQDADTDSRGTPQDADAGDYGAPQGSALDGYDTLRLIERTQGRMAGDHQWIAVDWMKEKPSGGNT